MSNVLAQIQAAAAAYAETGNDMNQSVKGGGGAKLLPEGYTLARLVKYVEFGKQPQEYNGKAKEPALEYRLWFALYSDGYTNDDGTPYIISTYNNALSRNEKAGAYLLFKSLNWKGTAKNFAQLVGEGFLLKIENYTPKTQGAQPRSRIDTKGFLPPLDALSKRPYDIPPAREDDLGLFLWDYPTLDGWKALHIEGTSDEGKSRNWMQETLLGATDFAGSPLESLLIANAVAYTVPPKAAQTPKTGAGAAPALPAVGTAPAAPATPVAPVMTAPAPAAPAGTPPWESIPGQDNPAVGVAVPAVPAVPVVPSVPAVPAVPAPVVPAA